MLNQRSGHTNLWEVEKNEPINIQVISQGIENEKKVRQGQIKEEDMLT